MIFVRLWNYLAGYVLIRVEGLSLEKFINLAISNGIYLWRINRASYTVMTACVGIGGFKRLHAISRKVRCRIRIVEKRGFPFVAYRYRHRKMLIAGMLIFLAVLYGFSSFIWTVDVEGTEKVKPQRILDELSELGVKPGAHKGGLDLLAIENRMIINIPQISWISIEIKGSRALVRVAESVLPPPMVDKSVPANLVARRDGIIHRMIVLEGEAVVKEGQTVREGQLLVSGVIDHPNTTGVRYVHSMGQIMARTWYEGRSKVSLKEPLRKRTGNKLEIRYVELGNMKMFRGSREIPYSHYDLNIREEPFFPNGRLIPVKIIVEEYFEVVETPLHRDIETAVAEAERLAWEDTANMIPQGAKVIDKQFKYDMIEGEEISAVIYAEVLEDIAIKKEILTVQERQPD